MLADRPQRHDCRWLASGRWVLTSNNGNKVEGYALRTAAGVWRACGPDSRPISEIRFKGPDTVCDWFDATRPLPPAPPVGRILTKAEMIREDEGHD